MKNIMMTLKNWLLGIKKQSVVVELCYGKHNDYAASVCIDGRWNAIDADWQTVQEWIAQYTNTPDQIKWVGTEPDNEIWHMPHAEFKELYLYHIKQFNEAHAKGDIAKCKAILLRSRTLQAMGVTL